VGAQLNLGTLDRSENVMAEKTLPDLRGKVIAIALAGTPDGHGTIIVDPHFEEEGGKLFIVGEIPAGVNPGDWNAGTTNHVNWDHVIEYTVFDSVEDYRQRVARARPKEGLH
jgi:hypothetical protein